MYIWKVEFPQTDPNGASWDAFGGMPDPKVTIGVNDAAVGSIAYDDVLKVDRTGQTFTPIRVTLKTGDALNVWASDVDVSSDDFADGSKFTAALELARQGEFSGKLYYQRVFVDFTIRPVP